MLTSSSCWRRAFYIAALVSAVSVAEATPAQDDRGARSVRDYDALLDAILPRDLNGTAYAFALRLTPSFRLESQLLVRIEDGGKVRAELAQVTGTSAWEALLARLETGRSFTIGDLARTIEVEKHAIAVDLATVQRWQDSLLDASRASVDELEQRAQASRRSRDDSLSFVLDGTLGELWYSQRGVAVHWGPFHVPEAGEKPNRDVHVPLAGWMTETMEAAQRRVGRRQPQ